MPFPCMTRELRGRSDPRRGAAELAPSNQNQSAAPRTSRRSHQPPLLLLLLPIQLITQGNKYLVLVPSSIQLLSYIAVSYNTS
jgi:hypothetical protein